MKVNDPKLSQLVPLAAQKAAEGSEKSEVKGPKERVSVSAPPEIDVASTAAAAAASRAQRVQEVIAAVKSGQYYPSPQQIANQLVSEAEIEARLRAILQ